MFIVKKLLILKDNIYSKVVSTYWAVVNVHHSFCSHWYMYLDSWQENILKFLKTIDVKPDKYFVFFTLAIRISAIVSLIYQNKEIFKENKLILVVCRIAVTYRCFLYIVLYRWTSSSLSNTMAAGGHHEWYKKNYFL